MFLRALCFSGLAAIFLVNPVHAQQLSQTDRSAQAASLLQKSLAAQTGGNAVTDVTLSGTFSFLKGKNPADTGSAALTALSDGATQAVLNLPSGTVTEVWSSSNGTATVSGSGPKGNITQAAGSDITMPAPAWFSPVLLTGLVSGSGYSSSFAGTETRNGTKVDHVIVWPNPSQDSIAPTFILRQEAQTDIYLDAATYLPVSAVFRVRPSAQPGKTLSPRARSALEEVRYANYKTVNGRAIPLHIQVYLGSKQIIDVTVSSVSFNTGATITAPN